MNRIPTVHVVDDDDAVRSSLRLLLKSVGLPTVTYESARDFLAGYDSDQPGCLVLDVRMPGMSGPELQEELNRRGAMIPVIFVTGHGDIPMAVEAMQHGAFDFLQKPFRDQDLITRVQKALELDAQNRAELREASLIRDRYESLTPREREVFQLLALGKANKEVAAMLGLSLGTVKKHRENLQRKLDCHSAAELARLAIREGLLNV